MRSLLTVLLFCVVGCATPVRVVETYVTDSTTGKTTKVIQKFYDSSRNDRWDYYQDDYVNLMFRPYMYYDPFFYDPFWGTRRLYYTPRVVVPVNPIKGPRVPSNAPTKPSIKKVEIPRPLPPGPVLKRPADREIIK